MHKRPEGKKSLGFVVAAALFVLAVVLFAFWNALEDTQRQGITMPDGVATEVESSVATMEPESLFLTVSPENIQQVLNTMERPSRYTQTFMVTSYWEEGSNDTAITIWRDGDFRKAEVGTAGATKHLLTDGETLWVWYQGEEKAAEFVCDETISFDDLLAIPTYELLTQLPMEDILQGQYLSEDENSLFITASQWQGGETGYWVDVNHQILTAAEVAQDGALQLSVIQTYLSFDDIADGVFATPEGTILETETQQP